MPIPTAQDIDKLWQEAAKLDVRPHPTQLHAFSHLLLSRFPVLIADSAATAAIKAENQRLWQALQQQNPADAALRAVIEENMRLKGELKAAEAARDRLMQRIRGEGWARDAYLEAKEHLEGARDAVIEALEKLPALPGEEV